MPERSVGSRTSSWSSSDDSQEPTPFAWWHPSLVLGLLPVVAWLLQWRMSVASGTEHLFWTHPTVQVADWAFVIMNPAVARGVDWSRGAQLLGLAALALIVNLLVHWWWQSTGADPGHMFSPSGVCLPAGWVHIGFATIEGTLVCAWLLLRRRRLPKRLRHTGDAGLLLYLSLAIPAGLAIQGQLMLSDGVVFLSGLLALILRNIWDRRHE